AMRADVPVIFGAVPAYGPGPPRPLAPPYIDPPSPTPRTRHCAASPHRVACRAPSPQARMVAPQSPIAHPALKRSALNFFAVPSTSPKMFHEERGGLRPRNNEDLEEQGRIAKCNFLHAAMWHHYFVDRIPSRAWQTSGYSPLPIVCAVEPPPGYPSPTVVPTMALMSSADLSADEVDVNAELVLFHGFLARKTRPQRLLHFTEVIAFLEALLQDIGEAKEWLRWNNIEHLF
ncbi:hypothetical protein H0H92_004676, partial [Tricholoma furcatifolium]